MLSRASILTRTAVSSSIATRALSAAAAPEYQHILTEKKGRVGYITLNRPKALNALCDALVEEVVHAGKAFDRDDSVGAIIITGEWLKHIYLF